MPEASDVPPTSKPKSDFNNWISAIGGVIATGALFSFALLVWIDFTKDSQNPYLGIFTYIVAPGFLIVGLVLIFFGAWAQRRWQIKHAATMPDKWRLDFTNPKQRRNLTMFGLGAAGFLMLSAFGSYQTYHYSESVQFCGEVCHQAMNPEFVAHQRSAHARITCAECHVGSGAMGFVQAKLNGTRQLVGYILDDYARPIPAPARNMPLAQDVCLKCHWPEKSHGNVVRAYDHYLTDKANSAYSLRLLLRVSEPRTGGGLGGIHWHAGGDEKVEYYATDPKRQEIPWVRVTHLPSGRSRVFRTEDFKDEPPADAIRTMDCMDCHNRPAHQFPTANDSIERALRAGTISDKLPYVKREAVKAMLQEDIATDADAPAKIADYLRKKYAEHPAEATAASAEVQRLFASTMFVERKADWREYPDNIGHKDWLGCFRCHDNKHVDTAGKTVGAGDCNSCHTLVAQGTGEELALINARGMEFKHPGGDLDPELTCADCHTGGLQQ
jgi:nitrate/TMAO reductase-like tetraheme cytochrome c subunit